MDGQEALEEESPALTEVVVVLTRVDGQLRVSDMNADEGSPHDAGSNTELPARI
jgi:hypothetical protein